MDETPMAVALPNPRHLSYYGLHDTPFGATVGPRPLWLGRTHREVLATLTAAIRDGDGGMFLLTGDVGTGKTGLVNRLIEMLSGDSLAIGRIPGPIFDVSELAHAVADALGIQGELPSGTTFATHVGDLLGRAGAPGKKVLLILDEGQNLSDELLHNVFELSSIGRVHGYPLAVLLVGQSELGDELAKDRYAELRQRITTRCVLEPLSEEEVGEYIRSCLEIAGSKEVIFDRDAIQQIASISRGAPGVINVICERALLAGYRRHAPVIDPGIIDGCLAERRPPSHAPVRHDQRLVGARRDSADDGGARDGGLERRGADVTGLARHVGRLRRQHARRLRVPPRPSRGTRWLPLLAAVVLGIGGGYALYAGIRGNLPHETVPDSPVERPGLQGAVGTTPSLAIGGREEGGSKVEAPIASPDEVGPKLPADGDRRRRIGAMTPTPSLRAREDRRPTPAPARESGRLPAVVGTAEPHDPGAVIDWLLREAGQLAPSRPLPALEPRRLRSPEAPRRAPPRRWSP